MKVVLQRVKKASVKVKDNTVGKISNGILLFLGLTHDDTEKQADYLIEKISKTRIFEDENGKMNNSVEDISGSVLIVSQFTLYANCKKGNRPSFTDAMNPVDAEKLYNYFVQTFSKKDLNIQTGEFGASMQVELLNDGPVTIVLDRDNKELAI